MIHNDKLMIIAALLFSYPAYSKDSAVWKMQYLIDLTIMSVCNCW